MREIRTEEQLLAWLSEADSAGSADSADSNATRDHGSSSGSGWLTGGNIARPEELLAVAVQGLDLGGHTEQLLTRGVSGCLFLGCTMGELCTGRLVAHGALVFPTLVTFEFDTHPPFLYDVPSLFAGFEEGDRTYQATLDARIYQEYLEQGGAFPASIRTTLARRLHDHGMTNALENLIEGRRVVAVMGGHNLERSMPFYERIAKLSRRLTRAGVLMVSGGGPGAMEATHLGAFVASQDDVVLDEALAILGPRPKGSVPAKEYADNDWLERAWRVRELLPIPTGEAAQCMSIGVPTWAYGHEPPAPFATHIAKYFANSVREAGLLTIARSGVVFAPGNAGTTQEIFQDAAQNRYKTAGFASPMVLWGSDYWTDERPVWPLLAAVSAQEDYGRLVRLMDKEDDIFNFLQAFEEGSG